MIERVNTVLRELQTQLIAEIANGRDAYFGPGFQEAVKAFSKLYLSGDVHLVLEKARQTVGSVERETVDDEFPAGFVRLELFAGGAFSVAVNAISAVRDLIELRTSRPSGAMVYVAGVAQGQQVMRSAAEVLAMIAREQKGLKQAQRLKLFAVEGVPMAKLTADMRSRGTVEAQIPPGVWSVVLERIPMRSEGSVGQ